MKLSHHQRQFQIEITHNLTSNFFSAMSTHNISYFFICNSSLWPQVACSKSEGNHVLHHDDALSSNLSQTASGDILGVPIGEEEFCTSISSA